MELVFATHNENKLIEVKALLPKTIKLLSLNDIGCNEEIAETADTIEGNAILKANYVSEKYGYNCFADDTGLEVKALNNEPGVYSARYAGIHGDSEANMEKLLKKLQDGTNRKARFKTAIALNFNNSKSLFIGICEGEILKSKQGNGGFGYDPIFKPTGYNETFAEMSLTLKGEISHRGKAMRQIIEYLSK